MNTEKLMYVYGRLKHLINSSGWENNILDVYKEESDIVGRCWNETQLLDLSAI